MARMTDGNIVREDLQVNQFSWLLTAGSSELGDFSGQLAKGQDLTAEQTGIFLYNCISTVEAQL